MNYFNRDSNGTYGLIEVNEYVNEFVEAQKWEDLASFAKEALTTAWVNAYMSCTRKIWTKQSGAGGQTQDGLGYEVLCNAVLDVLKAEQAEYGEDETDQIELDFIGEE
jgi:hypothetical protein